jgi:citrate:succinate antiporter
MTETFVFPAQKKTACKGCLFSIAPDLSVLVVIVVLLIVVLVIVILIVVIVLVIILIVLVIIVVHTVHLLIFTSIVCLLLGKLYFKTYLF